MSSLRCFLTEGNGPRRVEWHHTYRPIAMRLYTVACPLAVLGSVASLARAVLRVRLVSDFVSAHHHKKQQPRECPQPAGFKTTARRATQVAPRRPQ